MTETNSGKPEYIPRHSRITFDEIVPTDVVYPPETQLSERLQPGQPRALNMDRPLGVGPGHDVLAELDAGREKKFFVVDIRKTPLQPDGSRLFEDQRVEGDFLLVSEETDRSKKGFAVIDGPNPDRQTEDNPNGNFRVGRGLLKEGFDSNDAISRAHFDIVFDEAGQPSVIDLQSTNGTFIRQGGSRESAVQIPSLMPETAEAEDGLTTGESDASDPEQILTAEDFAEAEAQPGAEQAEAEETITLAPAEVFKSPESLMDALHNPDQFNPAEYKALQDVVAAWRERRTAQAVGEAWDKIRPKLEGISEHAQQEADGLMAHLNRLEDFTTSLNSLYRVLDAGSPDEINNAYNAYSQNAVKPAYEQPIPRPERAELLQITEDERQKVKAVAEAASETDLSSVQAEALTNDIRGLVEEGADLANITGSLREGLTGNEGQHWLETLSKIETIRLYDLPAEDQSGEYARLGRLLEGMENAIMYGRDRNEAFQNAHDARNYTTGLLDRSYDRLNLARRVSHIQPRS